MIGARRARQGHVAWNVIKTLVAVAVLQLLWFGALPWLVMKLHWAIGDTRLAFPTVRPLALVLFAVFGATYLASALVLAAMGRGTPLWIDAPRRLIVTGPYANVRNPMLLSAFGQGIATAFYGGSLLLVAYAGIGLFLWQIVIRAAEEDELVRRFGRAYESYRRGVPAFIPRRTAWIEVDDTPVRSLVVGDDDTRRVRRRRRA